MDARPAYDATSVSTSVAPSAFNRTRAFSNCCPSAPPGRLSALGTPRRTPLSASFFSALRYDGPDDARIAVSTAAASVTLRVIGPGTSNDGASGMIPVPLARPSVGFTPTTLLTSLGLMMLPEVSVPIVTAANTIAAATPEPADEPSGSPSVYGLTTCPPSDE